MHINLCFCDLLFKKELNTKVTVLMQWREQIITTNTAHLLPKLLTNAEIRFHGHENRKSLDIKDLLESEGTPLLLYPFSGATELSLDYVSTLKKPIKLFVPDGNWHQSLKMIKRTPDLLSMKKVTLPPGPPSSYKLRQGPTPDHLCTFEAISRALGIIEGIEIQNRMENVFKVMVDRVLWTRGKVALKDIA